MDAFSIKMESIIDGIRSSKSVEVVGDSEQRCRSLIELPRELQTEILVRMPVRSILLCKCVCKGFNNLIQTPNFIQTHLTRVTHQHSLILDFRLWIPDPYYERDHFLYSIDKITKDVLSFLPLTPPIPIVGNQFFFVGSCNGLICVLFYDENDDVIFLLWNPVIKQCRYLPKPLCARNPSAIEFGFIPETNNYLIVKVDLLQCGIYVEVYKMSIDSWVVIDCSMFAGADIISMTYLHEDSVFFNGSFHWMTAQCAGCNYILYYKLKDEELGLMKALDADRALIPNELDHARYHNEWKLEVIDESLAMIYTNHDLSRYEVWIMNEYGVEDSWAKRYEIVDDISAYLSPLGFWTSGNLMIINEQQRYHLYDLNTGERKKIPIPEMLTTWIITGFCSFVETLVPVR